MPLFLFFEFVFMNESNEENCPICCEAMNLGETLSLPCHRKKPHVYHKECVLENIRYLQTQQRENAVAVNIYICPECRTPYRYKYGEVNGYNVSFAKVFELYKYWSLYTVILIFVIPISMVSHGYVFYNVMKKDVDSIVVLNAIFSILINAWPRRPWR